MLDQTSIPAPVAAYLPLPKQIIYRESRRVSRANHRARKRGLVGDLTVHQWLAILNQGDWQCTYCGQNFQTLEHIVRLADGGHTTAVNVTPACTSCNRLRGQVAHGVAGMNTLRQQNAMHIVADLLVGIEVAYA